MSRPILNVFIVSIILLLITLFSLQIFSWAYSIGNIMAIAVSGSLSPSVVRVGVLVKEGTLIGKKEDIFKLEPGQMVKKGETIGISTKEYLVASQDGLVYSKMHEPLFFSVEEAINCLNRGGFPYDKQFLILLSTGDYKIVMEDLPWEVYVGQTLSLINIYDDRVFRVKVVDKLNYQGKGFLVLGGEHFTQEVLSQPWQLYYLEQKPIEGIIVPLSYIKKENEKYFVKALIRGKVEIKEIVLLTVRGNDALVRGINAYTFLLPWQVFKPLEDI